MWTVGAIPARICAGVTSGGSISRICVVRSGGNRRSASAPMALTRASHCSACLRKSSMFFMLSSSFEGLSGGSGGAGVDARPGVTEPVRRREPAVRDGGLLPSAGDEARTEPSPLRRNRFCAVPRLRLPGAEASRRGSPGLGGRICRWVGM